MSAFIWAGNHPGLDLVNTTPVIQGRTVELLPDLDALMAWCGEAGLLRDGLAAQLTRLTARDAAPLVEWSRDLRAALRALLEGRSVFAQPSISGSAKTERTERPDDYARLNQLLAGLTGSLVITGEPRPRLDLLAGGPAQQLQLDLAQATTGALTELDPTRIRRCANPQCILLFHDTSKGGRRRWCDMTVCGNRAKSAAHYRRHRASPEQVG